MEERRWKREDNRILCDIKSERRVLGGGGIAGDEV